MPIFIEIVVDFFRTIIVEFLVEVVFYGVYKFISSMMKKMYRGLKKVFSFRRKKM